MYCKIANYKEQNCKQRHPRYNQPRLCRKTKHLVRLRCQEFQRHLHTLFEVVPRFPRKTILMLYIQHRFTESHPLNIHYIATVVLPHLAVCIDNFSVSYTEVADRTVIGLVCCNGINLVKAVGYKNLQLRIMSFLPAGKYNIVALHGLCVQVRNFLRSVLQITIHDNYPIPFGIIEPRSGSP